jgi:metallo-beta-lactamase family protein
VTLSHEVSIRFFHAGHILGASSVDLHVHGTSQKKHIVFSGDLGPYESPLHFAPDKVGFADVLLVESTYGNRNREGDDALFQFRDIIKKADERNGCLVIPAFSVGRTQLILYYLWKLFSEEKVHERPVYIDSPMAISVTDLYRKYSHCHRLNHDARLHKIFDAPFFKYVTDQGVSKSLNEIKKNAIIISASGMCTGGRILHHLFHRLPRYEDTILLTGYQAEGSRGRRMAEGEEIIKIFGEEVPVHADIAEINGLSAHADQSELLRWLDDFVSPPKWTFVVHGEKESATTLKQELEARNWNAFVPEYLESFQLFQGI